MSRFLWIVLWVISGFIIGPVHSWFSGGGFIHSVVAGILGWPIGYFIFLFFKFAKASSDREGRRFYYGIIWFLLIYFNLSVILRIISMGLKVTEYSAEAIWLYNSRYMIMLAVGVIVAIIIAAIWIIIPDRLKKMDDPE